MPPTDEQQRMLAKDLQYEIDEFRNSFEELASLKVAGRKDSAWNRALESALLHFRNLRAFFFCEGNHPKSDVFAIHFISSWNVPNGDPVFGSTRQRINKRLAHVTIERLEVQPDWPELDEMNAAVEKLISKFKESLPPTKAGWFPRLSKSTVRFLLGPADNSTASGPVPVGGVIDFNTP